MTTFENFLVWVRDSSSDRARQREAFRDGDGVVNVKTDSGLWSPAGRVFETERGCLEALLAEAKVSLTLAEQRVVSLKTSIERLTVTRP